jgi:pimeloyl-ACP methyl ester carboxylesterase
MISNNCGYNLYYEISGNNEGEWLILLHGLAGSTRCWKYQIDALNKHFRVLSLDLPGHGNSDGIDTETYSAEIIANHIRMLLDVLRIDKAHMLGLSLGTIILQYFCEMFPERVITSILASPVSKPNYFLSIMNSFVGNVFLKIFNKDIYIKVMAYLMLPGNINKKTRKFFLIETAKMSNKEFVKWRKLVEESDYYYNLSKCSIPSLIIVGGKDFYYYDHALKVKERYINSEFKIIKDAGHVLIFQKPEEFNTIVINFIRQYKCNNLSNHISKQTLIV